MDIKQHMAGWPKRIKAAGLTQYAFSESLGIRPTIFSRYVKGTMPKLDRFEKIEAKLRDLNV